MTRIVWKFPFCSLHLQWWFRFLEKVLMWLKNVTSIKNLPTSNVESFLKPNFWPKSNVQNSAYTKPVNVKLTKLICFIFSLKFIEMLWSYKACQKIGVRSRQGRVRTKCLFAQTIPDKMFETKWSNPVKLDRKRKVWYLFLRVF